LPDQEKVEKEIREIVPEEAEITNIIFDFHRSIVVIEAKKTRNGYRKARFYFWKK